MSDDSSPHDWTTIEGLYRAGDLSVREIARRHHITDGAIRKRALRDGWDRDLAGRVQDAVRTALVSGQVRASAPVNEAQVIEEAAKRGVEIVMDHRRLAARIRLAAYQLIDRLEAGLRDQDMIAEAIDEERDARNRAALHRALALPEQAKTLDRIAQTLGRIVPIERQAHSIDDTTQDPAQAPDRVRLRDQAYTAVMDLLADRAKNVQQVIETDFQTVATPRPALSSPAATQAAAPQRPGYETGGGSPKRPGHLPGAPSRG